MNCGRSAFSRSVCGYVNDPVLRDITRAEIVFVRVQIEPDVCLATRGFGELRDLVGLGARAVESCERQSFHLRRSARVEWSR